MINPKELRIGNILQNGYRTVKVSSLFKGHFKCETLEQCSLDTSVQLNYTGIPLTEEWLLKLGFKDNGFGGFEISYNPSKYNDSIITYRIGKSSYSSIGWFLYEGAITIKSEIEHVHQLQNLYFALTGEELEIK